MRTQCLEQRRHFWISSVSAYDLEKQQPRAPKEVRPQMICKQLLVKSQAREILLREETMRNGDTSTPLGILSSIAYQLNSESMSPQQPCGAVFTDLQFNALPSAFVEICCKNHSAIVVQSWSRELPTTSFKVTHKNVVLRNFVLVSFLP